MSHSIAFGYSMKCSYTSLSFNALWHCLQVLQLFSPFCTRTYVHASRHVNHHYIKTFAWSIVKGGHKPSWPHKSFPALPLNETLHTTELVQCHVLPQVVSFVSIFLFTNSSKTKYALQLVPRSKLSRCLRRQGWGDYSWKLFRLLVREQLNCHVLKMERHRTMHSNEDEQCTKSRTSTSFMIVTPTHSCYIHTMSVILNKFVKLQMV